MINHSFLEEISFFQHLIFGIMSISSVTIIILVLLFPYLLYVPGDDSFIEILLTNSNKPQAKLLINHKKRVFKNKF
jgi:hypothetical protein